MHETNLITIERPQPPAIAAKMAPVVAAAVTFVVTDVETHAEALRRIKDCRAAEKQIEAECDGMKKAVQAAHKETLAFIARFVGPIQAARGIYDINAAAFEAREKKKAEDESRRLQAEARKQEEERTLLAAIEAEEQGDTAASESILADPVSVPVVTVAPAVAKVEGVSSRTLWSAKVDDVRKSLRFLLERDEWLPLLEKCIPVLETGFRALAIAQHEALAIPGVRAVSESSRSTR